MNVALKQLNNNNNKNVRTKAPDTTKSIQSVLQIPEGRFDPSRLSGCFIQQFNIHFVEYKF